MINLPKLVVQDWATDLAYYIYCKYGIRETKTRTYFDLSRAEHRIRIDAGSLSVQIHVPETGIEHLLELRGAFLQKIREKYFVRPLHNLAFGVYFDQAAQGIGNAPTGEEVFREPYELALLNQMQEGDL
jgi:hypothetical protein